MLHYDIVSTSFFVLICPNRLIDCCWFVITAMPAWVKLWRSRRGTHLLTLAAATRGINSPTILEKCILKEINE